MQTFITTRPFKHESRSYDHADKFDLDKHVKSGSLDERAAGTMQRSGAISELTPDTFKLAYERRDSATDPVPFGFTRAGLEAMGFTLRGTAAPPKKAAPPPPPPKKEDESKVLDTIELKADVIVHGDFRLQPRQGGLHGKQTFYDATDKDGRLLRANGFSKLEKATAFLDDLVKTAASTETPAAATPEPVADPEQDDGRDVQSQPGGSDQQSAPAPG